MLQAFICDAIRTPFGRYGGALSSVRTDDLGAIALKALMARNPNVDWQAVTDVIFGCANQVGWRLVNNLMKENYGVVAMPETAENIATAFKALQRLVDAGGGE